MLNDQAASLASARAEIYAPRPTGGACAAGICGAVTALIGHVSVCGFYGWSAAENPALAVVSTVAGFGVVYGVYLRRRVANDQATRAEYGQILHEEALYPARGGIVENWPASEDRSSQREVEVERQP